jgi:hypothetical protein
MLSRITLPLLPIIVATMLATAANAGTDIVNEINYKPAEKSTLDELSEKVSLGYFVNVNGPKISNPTGKSSYNKFNSGRNSDGYAFDATSNQGSFNSFTLKYQYSNNINFSYSYAFVNSITTNTKYKSSYNSLVFDENGFAVMEGNKFKTQKVTEEYTRGNSQVFLNQRINAYIGNIYQNKTIGMSLGLSYEMPTSEGSQENDMLYGIVLSPSIYFKTNNIKHSFGVGTTIQRDFYKENVVAIDGCPSCDPMLRRTLILNIAPYYNYSLADKLTLQTEVSFDYDQQGNQQGFEFGNNLDNTARVGLGYTINQNLNTSIYVEGSMENPSTDKAFIGATLGITI